MSDDYTTMSDADISETEGVARAIGGRGERLIRALIADRFHWRNEVVETIFAVAQIMGHMKVNINCNTCLNTTAVDTIDERIARAELAKEGWTYAEGHDFCPECTKKRAMP